MIGRRSASPSDGDSGGTDPPSWVLLDTNALFLPFTGSIDLEAGVATAAPAIPIGVTTGTLGELDALRRRGVAHSHAAREYAARFPTVASRGRGDSGLLEVAQALGAWVVTTDHALRDRLVARGVSVLEPRGRSRLRLVRGRPPQKRGARGDRRATVKNGTTVVRADRRRNADAPR